MVLSVVTVNKIGDPLGRCVRGSVSKVYTPTVHHTFNGCL